MLQIQDQQGLRVEDIFIGKLFLCVTFEIHEIENRLSRYVSNHALTLTKTIIFRRYMCDWSLAKIKFREKYKNDIRIDISFEPTTGISLKPNFHECKCI